MSTRSSSSAWSVNQKETKFKKRKEKEKDKEKEKEKEKNGVSIAEYTAAELYIIGTKDKAQAERLQCAQLVKTQRRLSEATARDIANHMCPSNVKLFQRWTKSTGLCARAFLRNPELATFLPDSGICYAARYYGEPLAYDGSTGAVRGMVAGEWVDMERVASKLRFQYARYRNKLHKTIVSRASPSDTWCYLPQGGLTRWNQCEWQVLQPCAMFSCKHVCVAQRRALLATAEAELQENTQQKEEEEIVGLLPTCVIEVVSTKATKSSTSLIFAVQHPWLRVILNDGRFYCFGFTKSKHLLVPSDGGNAAADDAASKAAIKTMSGTFATPEFRESAAIDSRIITGIRVSTEQAVHVLRAVQTFQNTGIGFRYINHNCTSFVQLVLHTLFANTPGVEHADFHMSYTAIAHYAQPQWMRNLEQMVSAGIRMLRASLPDTVIPESILRPCMSIVSASVAAITGRAINSILATGDEHPLEDLPFCKKEKETSKDIMPDVALALVSRTTPTMAPTAVAAPSRFKEEVSSWVPLVTRIKANSPIAYIPLRVAQWQMRQPGTLVFDDTIMFWNQYE